MTGTIAEYAAAICLLVGAFFMLVGAIGILKFYDPMTRLHAPTKVSTVGVGAMLLGSMIHSYAAGTASMHQVLIMAFLFVTAPISANFLSKVAIHRRACETPPAPMEDDTWSTLDVPEADRVIEAQQPEGAPEKV